MLRAPRITLLLVLAAAAAGCAHNLKELKPGPDIGRWVKAMDWQAAGDETVEVLSGYLRVNTANPPGNERAGALYLGAILEKEQIPYEIVDLAPGRASLIARLKGSGSQPPLCLLSHIDVATVDEAEWPDGKGPWSGTVDEDGMIWGRGAIDMKGMGALELMTMVWLKRLKVPLSRDVILLAVADEEVNNLGMQQIVDHHWGRIGCSHLVNEGGLGIKDIVFEGQTVNAISVGEKGVLWLKMNVRGAGGHGSTPRPELTTAKLMDLVNRIRAREVEPNYHPATTELFARVGDHGGGFKGFVLKRPSLVGWLAEGDLMEGARTRAALIDTIHVTGLATGTHEPNVVPTKASALLDCRLQPGTTPEELIEHLEWLTGCDPCVTFEVIFSAPASVSPWDDPFYEALARHSTADRGEAVAGPAVSVGFTDSLYARAKGVRAYGFVPFELTQDELSTMHAPEERISVANVHRGLRVLFSAVLEVAAAPGLPDVPEEGR